MVLLGIYLPQAPGSPVLCLILEPLKTLPLCPFVLCKTKSRWSYSELVNPDVSLVTWERERSFCAKPTWLFLPLHFEFSLFIKYLLPPTSFPHTLGLNNFMSICLTDLMTQKLHLMLLFILLAETSMLQTSLTVCTNCGLSSCICKIERMAQDSLYYCVRKYWLWSQEGHRH